MTSDIKNFLYFTIIYRYPPHFTIANEMNNNLHSVMFVQVLGLRQKLSCSYYVLIIRYAWSSIILTNLLFIFHIKISPIFIFFMITENIFPEFILRIRKYISENIFPGIHFKIKSFSDKRIGIRNTKHVTACIKYELLGQSLYNITLTV